MARKYSDQEIAEMLVQIMDADSAPNYLTTGVEERDYLGQGVHVLYIQRDTAYREATREHTL